MLFQFLIFSNRLHSLSELILHRINELMYDFSFARARYGFVEAARKLFIKLDHAQCSTQAPMLS